MKSKACELEGTGGGPWSERNNQVRGGTPNRSNGQANEPMKQGN